MRTSSEKKEEEEEAASSGLKARTRTPLGGRLCSRPGPSTDVMAQ